VFVLRFIAQCHAKVRAQQVFLGCVVVVVGGGRWGGGGWGGGGGEGGLFCSMHFIAQCHAKVGPAGVCWRGGHALHRLLLRKGSCT
jgi:hypothetical protein